MFEAERKISGLEADTFASVKHAQRHAFGNNLRNGLGKRLVLVSRAIIQQLDFETIEGPVQPRGSSGDA